MYYTRRKHPFQEVTLKVDGYHLHLQEIKSPDQKAVIVAT
ncbi:MAG: hypothetical protein IGBAC_1245 [Ignavibacteriae bacterium]|nr:MAG: hypothetical protein IGBAC_1245 [Ignavibacteriota bacterium]